MTRSNDDDRNIFPNISDDPIAAAEALQEELGGVRKQLYLSLSKAVAIAEVLEGDAQKWTAFKANAAREGWHVPKMPLRAVMCFVFKAKKPSGPAYERACCYTRAIMLLREDLTVFAHDIPQLIRDRGGIEELYAEAKLPRDINEGNGADSESDRRHDNAQETEASADSLKAADGTGSAPAPAVANSTGLPRGGKSPRKTGGSAGDGEPRKFTKRWCEERFILEILPGNLEEALNMRNRQRGSLDFIYSGKDDTGFKIFNIQAMRLK